MTDPQDGYFNLKHRLVGATALILVAVILLPRVLTGTHLESVRSSRNERTAPQIQPQVSGIVNPADSRSVEDLIRAKIEIIEGPVVATTDGKTGVVQFNEARSAADVENRNTEVLSSSDSSNSKSIVTGFIVQLGIFQQPENIRNLISDLKMDGIDAKEELIEIDGRQVTRIWLGPFSARSEAVREGNKAMMRTHSKPIVKEWP